MMLKLRICAASIYKIRREGRRVAVPNIIQGRRHGNPPKREVRITGKLVKKRKFAGEKAALNHGWTPISDYAGLFQNRNGIPTKQQPFTSCT
jgi:hypothetical protein